MVQPIDSFYIYPNSLGSELDLYWSLPDELPSEFAIYLFRKTAEELTNEDIVTYFYIDNEIRLLSEIPNPAPEDLQLLEDKKTELNNFFKVNKIEVKNFDTEITEYFDFKCFNRTEYFYQVCVQNKATNELSAPASASSTPLINAEFSAFDSKQNVIKAVEWVLNSISTENNSSLNLNVFKEFPMEEGIDQWIVVRRVLPEAPQRFLGDWLHEWNDHIVSGHIEKEIIEVKWYCRNNIERRDSINKLFRSQTQSLKRYILHSGAIEALFNFLEDGIETRDTGYNLYYSGMLVSVLSEASTISRLDTAPIFPEFIPASAD